MWTRLLVKPFWTRVAIVACVCASLYGIEFFASWVGGYHLADAPKPVYHNVLLTIVWQAIGYGLCGVIVAAFTSNSNAIYIHALRGLDPQRRSAAVDAAFRGPVPADWYVRNAAIRVATRRLQCNRSWRAFWLVISSLLVLVLVLRATRNDWQGLTPDDWADFVLVPCFAVTAWYVSRRAEQRVQMLWWTANFNTTTVCPAG